MLDRLKGARSAENETSDRKRDEAKFDDGMPRFQPQPGGFGRRATPVGAAPAAQPKEIEISPGASPQPQFRKAEPRPGADAGAHSNVAPGANGGWTNTLAGAESAQATSALGDIPTRIADWLMRELKDERGIHCETILTVVGALAGYSAQQALWEGMVKPGKLAIAQAFKVVETGSGATYFFGDALDTILASMEPKHLSIWKIVAASTLAAGGDHLPDMGNLLRHCAATVGTSAFGLPRLPDDHLPSIMPRPALEQFWPGARLLLALAEPLHWPLHMANAAQKLMLAMKGSIASDLAVRIVMEAAVPMSRVDPTTVPNN
jgi:hypothetical protein